MDSPSSPTQENLMGFVEGELGMANEFLEDAVAYLQLCHFFLAMESLQSASQAMDIAERYLSDVTEPNHRLQYQSNVRVARERVRHLEQSITTER